jgi:hypothetical protein
MLIKGLRAPVRRDTAAFYLFLMLLAFAISVVGTRLFLELAGYPQIGNSELHVAHVLWGGLAMFIGGLLPLIFANRWSLTLSAVLSGVGVGLFIDEVGKFITQSNDYFYPLAAPIIYATFLITALIYVRVRQPIGKKTARAELYHALDELMEVIDRDLNPRERAEMQSRLQFVSANADDPDIRQLAEVLEKYVSTHTLKTVPDRVDIWGRLWFIWLTLEERVFKRHRMRVVVIALLIIVGLGAFGVLAVFLPAIVSKPDLFTVVDTLTRNLRNIAGEASLSWAITWLVLHAICGVLILGGGLLTLIQRENLGTRVGFFGLLISATIVDLITFYFNQFAAVSIAFMHFAVLFVVLRYRVRYVLIQATTQSAI